MVNLDLHLPHQQEKILIKEVAAAIANPAQSPVMFNVWGMTGVGKSTLLTKFQEGLAGKDTEIHFAKISFDTSYVTPLDVMVALHKDLPKISGLQERFAKNPFIEKYKTYQDTLTKLNTRAVKGKTEVDKDQIDLVKTLVKFSANAGIWAGKAALTAGISNPMTDYAASVTNTAVGHVVDATIDGVTSALSVKDRLMDELLRKHDATKNDSEIRELMLEPLPKLTEAFIDSLISRAAKTPVVLILDTYEKASIEFDTWLQQLFFKHNQALKNSKLRIVTAGQYQLLKKEGWGNFVTTDRLVREIPLKEFDLGKSKSYFEKSGFTDKREIAKLYKITNGLPYYLQLVAHQKEQGIAINHNETMENRILVGLNEIQQNFVRLAACCRWFDRPLIQSLVERQEVDFTKSIDANLSCFDWLKNLNFIEFIDRGRYRLVDTVRNVIRRSLTSDELKDNHTRLHKYFEEIADCEVPPTLWDEEKYENPVWCEYTSEAIYHAFFSLRRNDCKVYFLKHFFASRYFNQINVVASPPMAALISEAEFDENKLFPHENKKFLDILKVLLPIGWYLVALTPQANVKLDEKSLSEAELARLEKSIKKALETVDALPDGLAKWQALMCKCRRSPRNRIVDILRKAEEQAKFLENQIEPSSCSNLFRGIGDFFYSLSEYEKAITDYDKAIELNPDSIVAWNNRGNSKDNLQRYEEAIADYDKAIALNPDDAVAWNNRGTTKGRLQREEEAITDLDKAIILNPDYLNAWINRGTAKINLYKYKEAIADVDKAITLNPDNAHAWAKRGVILTRLGQYDQALENFNRSINLDPNDLNHQIDRGVLFAWMGRYVEAIRDCDSFVQSHPNDVNALYGLSCCYALQGNIDESIKYLAQAISQEPEETKNRTKKDPEFNGIREDKRFQDLVDC